MLQAFTVLLFVSDCVKSTFTSNTQLDSLPKATVELLRRNPIESLLYPQPWDPSAASAYFVNDRKDDQDVINNDDETSIPLQKEYLQFMEEFVFFREVKMLDNKFENMEQNIHALTESSHSSNKVLCDKLHKYSAFASKLLEHRTAEAHIDLHKALQSWAITVIDHNPPNIFLSKLFQAKIVITMYRDKEFTDTIQRFLYMVQKVKNAIDKYCFTTTNPYIEESEERRAPKRKIHNTESRVSQKEIDAIYCSTTLNPYIEGSAKGCAPKRKIHGTESRVSQKEIDALNYQYFGYHLYVFRTQYFLSYLKRRISKKLITNSSVLSEMECEYITLAVQYMQAVFKKMKTQTKKMSAIRNQLKHDLATRNNKKYVSPHQEWLIAFIQSAQKYSISDHIITNMRFLCNTEETGNKLNERKLSAIRYIVGYYTRTQEEITPLTSMIVSKDRDYSKLQLVNNIISSIEFAVRYRRDIINVAKKWQEERLINRIGAAQEESNIVRITCGELKYIQAVCKNLHGHGSTPLEADIPTLYPMVDEKAIKTYFEQNEPCDDIDKVAGVLKSHKISAYRLSGYISGMPNITHRWYTLIEVEINNLIDECKALCPPEDTQTTSEELSPAVSFATKHVAMNLEIFVSWLIAYQNVDQVLAHSKNITAACDGFKEKEKRQFVLIETLQYIIFYDNIMSHMEKLPLTLTKALDVINSQGGIVRTLISDQILLTIRNTDIICKDLQKAESNVLSSLIGTLNTF